ncbi:excinuclease ABC subunit B [Candidatus Daviesbacteria bacterium RIFCSPHIGHO2_12_FULL_37_11]|uniref:UvrABC system protein B n=1 Tax=Candidatus Daviesbacteria bacterium RIFCSPHIGHO2_12_FULL_37_11 TaxID=1797777 RepID=A0A1F5KCK9_9BACT|nr:MAG: excinuclease ABC subunit B [Candidatus Daviesbacteria bacterium RIFCSPHIGHO2_01_FULL_37_27]OGE38495.1 MAG: excinuclease ABC subunit B [Candidatus Daviesbacteria bacterium RIFCSPHIGHO2_12_FULL_37_11]OGE45710.1 MAG: excinuclease ABC subunit B [Candidatus Daviesbacteria bacterium RIFCSPLOWO2_01_FULL_37_10]
MTKFKIASDFKPTGDQPQAIEKLVAGLNEGREHQVLLGVTGSGKTFTMANVVERVQRPTLVISHNKTLAGQLAQEFKSIFPNNAVEYFVSYYDYYQPEAYIPQSDTYIEKDASINEEIEKLRLSATTSLMTRKDVIVVASVSAIYNLGSPVEYGQAILELKKGMKATFQQVLKVLQKMYYDRNDIDFKRGTYRVRGDTIDIFPAYKDSGYRVQFTVDRVERVAALDPVTGHTEDVSETQVIYPAKHYITPEQRLTPGIKQIEIDLGTRLKELRKLGKLVEAQRLEQKTQYDLEMIKQYGYCNGIENYSRYFDGRSAGDPPYTLMHFFPKDFLLFIDESHMSIPQIRGMYNGDRSRKETLVEYGFRLPSALDNRPLKYDEFQRIINQTVYVSATPDEYELSLTRTYPITLNGAKGIYPSASLASSSTRRSGPQDDKEYDGVAEQLIRPTGVLDPEVEVRKTEGQIENLMEEIRKRVEQGERVLITTLTKRMAEDLADYLKEHGVKVHYLHSDVVTLERGDILQSLRLGEYDVLVGINLLREGLDLPEVSLVVILDADKEGFLRSRTSLIQTMGRAARHINGKVIMYADTVTKSMKAAIDEVTRRRKYQAEYNKKNNITPKSIEKALRDRLIEKVEELEEEAGKELTVDDIPVKERDKMVKLLEAQMREAAEMLDFETAAKLRDQIKELSV